MGGPEGTWKASSCRFSPQQIFSHAHLTISRDPLRQQLIGCRCIVERGRNLALIFRSHTCIANLGVPLSLTVSVEPTFTAPGPARSLIFNPPTVSFGAILPSPTPQPSILGGYQAVMVGSICGYSASPPSNKGYFAVREKVSLNACQTK